MLARINHVLLFALLVSATDAAYITDKVYSDPSCDNSKLAMNITNEDGKCLAAPKAYQRAWKLDGYGWTGLKTVGGSLVYTWSSESLEACQSNLDAQIKDTEIFDKTTVSGSYMTVAEANDGQCRGDGYTFDSEETYCPLRECRVRVTISDVGVHGAWFYDENNDVQAGTTADEILLRVGIQVAATLAGICLCGGGFLIVLFYEHNKQKKERMRRLALAEQQRLERLQAEPVQGEPVQLEAVPVPGQAVPVIATAVAVP